MKVFTIFTITFFILFTSFGQNNTFYKTTKRQNFHYVELNNSFAIVYKMGSYLDKAGTGSAISKVDTLIKISEQDYKGNNYLLSKQSDNFYLQTSNSKKINLVIEPDFSKVNTELNNAYYLKSYFDLSDKLNKEFPLYHYTFRNGYYAWNKLTQRNISYDEFIRLTDKEIKIIYDSISNNQKQLTNTANFIKENASKINYDVLKDSLSKLPIEYCPQSCYFSKSVYQIVKVDPNNFYRILEDFPTNKIIIFFAVEDDKELVKRLKQIKNYKKIKREIYN
jgi:hypothetical protein